MANGAVAQKRHRPVRDATMGFNLGPPHATMAQTDAVFVQGFGDDHVVHMREMAVLGEVSHPAIAARFLVRRR